MMALFQSALFLGFVLAASVHAGPRTSANYSITTEAIAAAGNHSTSANYSSDASAGAIIDISTVPFRLSVPRITPPTTSFVVKPLTASGKLATAPMALGTPVPFQPGLAVEGEFLRGRD